MSTRQRKRRVRRQPQSPNDSLLLDSTLPNQQQRRAHRNTLTCTNCRVRKTKCDGTQPGCKTCEVYHDTCRYEKVPPMSQIISMSRKLQEYERQLEAMRENIPGPMLGLDNNGQPVNIAATSDTTSEHGLNPGHDKADQEQNNKPGQMLRLSTSLISDLSVDENGKLCYYGPTSAVHDPLNLPSHSTISSEFSNPISDSALRTTLVSDALESRSWEDFAVGNAALGNDIPKETISKLLQLHWSWIAPMFMWVYRPAFMRDMLTGGQYFSQLLLLIICAHSSRFQGTSIGEILIYRARLLLGKEIQKPSSIPTVQALLQLSARDLAFGSISQAWLYSGMAFRMVSDLGLHHYSGRVVQLGHLTAEDLEIRRRLFWSCYFWDKAISLYLGRMPALSELPSDHQPIFFDDSTADEIWAPYYCDASNTTAISPEVYPPMKSYSVSCFGNSCKLAIIINQIILQLYSRNTVCVSDSTLRDIREQLDNWRTQSPEYLTYDPDNLSGICCPPHILTQNLLYYTTVILLHRPFYSSPIHHSACRHAAASIEKLLIFLERTFGFTQITYLMAYCVYTAASAIIQDVKEGDANASEKMNTFLRALKGGLTTCPIVQRSIDIINSGLAHRPLNDAATASSSQFTVGDNNFSTGYLPAFPHHNLQANSMVFDNVGVMDSDSVWLLNCFPENHIDLGNSEWFVPS
ncbi:fungal-specific transcription factor domain-containing protein [Talaromyces proteolyticus]|uniref:Fungal-specific transcription factor domain-containing protein n=1 Tax=Talaromyces proteolyticus TaxID=1131652 RepID=A0AAD4PV73_9EURO|nr:fungal-specific transcription factor domain-containing protein [Talaromyces proteolyticus]KAH8690326.1 fungal-specific transcription factor domain-containing protein [Talaromyces proteolyticus]